MHLNSFKTCTENRITKNIILVVILEKKNITNTLMVLKIFLLNAIFTYDDMNIYYRNYEKSRISFGVFAMYFLKCYCSSFYKTKQISAMHLITSRPVL